MMTMKFSKDKCIAYGLKHGVAIGLLKAEWIDKLDGKTVVFNNDSHNIAYVKGNIRIRREWCE